MYYVNRGVQTMKKKMFETVDSLNWIHADQWPWDDVWSALKWPCWNWLRETWHYDCFIEQEEGERASVAEENRNEWMKCRLRWRKLRDSEKRIWECRLRRYVTKWMPCQAMIVIMMPCHPCLVKLGQGLKCWVKSQVLEDWLHLGRIPIDNNPRLPTNSFLSLRTRRRDFSAFT